MKKFYTYIVILLLSTLHAQEISITEGWQLKGTEAGFTHMEVFNKDCINMVWVFDKTVGWKAFTNDVNMIELIHNSSSIATLTSIEKNDGFWINANSECIVSNQMEPSLELPLEIQSLLDENSSVLTTSVKESLVYMLNEERLAYDIYTQLYALFPTLKQFTNIANNAEYKHFSTMQKLVEKYDINSSDYSSVTNPIDYSNADISTMQAGVYEIPALSTLYDILYAKGSQSEIDAYEVGCMVEVTDINDLNQDIEIAEGINATDIVDALNLLRDGSYSHYWSFDKGLVNKGVSEGCCSLGSVNSVDYCHPEYPQVVNANGNN